MTEEAIQITIQASKLKTSENGEEKITSALAVVTLLPDQNNDQPITLGETEIIENCRDPHWNKKFLLSDIVENKPTYFLVKIFNKVCGNDYKELGSGVFDISEILQIQNNTVTKKLKSGGTIDVRVEKVVGMGSLHLKMSGVSLKTFKRGFKNKIKPFYEFSRKEIGPSGPEWKVVHRCEDIGQNSPSPTWQDEQIDLGRLCYNEVDLPLRLSIYHHRSNGKHSIVGEVETSVNALIAASKSSSRLQIISNGIVTGRLSVLTASLSIEEKREVVDETERTSSTLDEGDIYASFSSASTCPVAAVSCTPCQDTSATERYGAGKLAKELSTKSMLFTSSSTINCI
mmetsp:Transcript_25054/g.37469  ORF Transcript_25054/g.37469 Transcript_25054/m.37469 type:complete len:343 (-) Transcript_25054:255-1283(-)|eukprot:CAMPEP_0203663590 /NCGR_PEP_ID=MMETSP0090-20130426/1176_1 /ASSEMBLY_ACC=CAM_ASM_001088 /TAXON_ID=426623 /ORGANISM="Chaetoceros affinis, Strain CCMP159" /LENGTH=342 /DNA_ID=CAMNT_0050526567 /DNA_START=112 /DNA_END=1140 /DNA_ORIENTATION=+